MSGLSPPEEQRVREYDQAVVDQLWREREYADRPLKKISLDPLFEALEHEAMETIRDANIEIGVLLRCKETFPSRHNSDRVDFIVRMLRYRIEEDHSDIQRWRRYAKTA